MTTRTPLLVALVLLAAACAAEQRAAPPPAGTLPTADAPPAATPARPGPGEWKTWSHERKLAYMKEAVLPHEVTYFHVYSPQRFPQITCKTCHGASVADGSYTMPNPALPKLAPGHLLELEKTQPNAFHFMLDVIVRRTAELLGEPEWSHETMSGFGCFNCHPNADKESAGKDVHASVAPSPPVALSRGSLR